MPHLLSSATKTSGGAITARHLCRTSDSRHLGAGYISYTMSKDTYKNFIWGSYYSTSKACGYTAASSTAGEESVADQLKAAVQSGNSNWPYQGNEWNTQGWGQPCYWYFSGGMCVSGANNPEVASEAALAVTAYHFVLPEVYRTQGLQVLEARLVYKGLGSFVQNLLRPSTKPMFYPTKDWEENKEIWGSSYKLDADRYPDNQSIAVHFVHGATLTKSVFNPAKCFFVYNKSGTAYEFQNLQSSFYLKMGRYPTDAELLSIFNIDMADDQNKHWKTYGWQGSRSSQSASNRYQAHTWAMSNGGTQTTQALFTAGSGWGFPYISGANPYPANDSYLFQAIYLSDADKAAITSANGLWVIAHGLPMLSRQNLTGGSYLPTSASNWEFGPWVGKTNSSSVGRYIGTAIQSMDTYQLVVTLGH